MLSKIKDSSISSTLAQKQMLEDEEVCSFEF
jgi:hypothetical protein